jgi:hypothetical protein
LRNLGRASSGGNVARNLLELREHAPGKEDLRALASECTGHRATDRAAAAVDHGVLVFNQHLNVLLYQRVCADGSRRDTRAGSAASLRDRWNNEEAHVHTCATRPKASQPITAHSSRQISSISEPALAPRSFRQMPSAT